MRMLPRPHFHLHDTLDSAHGISKFDAISADSEEELLQAAVEHAVSVHHHSDTPELRQQLASARGDDARFQSLLNEVFDLVELGIGSGR